MTDNLLEGGAEELDQVKDALQRRDMMQETLLKMDAEKKKVDGESRNTENAASEEVSRTVKERRSRIVAEYKAQTDSLETKRRKVQQERARKRDKKQGDRISEETAAPLKEVRDLENEMKVYFREQKVPGFCRKQVYFDFFMPRGGEIIRTVLLFFLFIAAIPAAGAWVFRLAVRYSDLTEQTKLLFTVLIPAVLLILFIVIYFLIYIKTKAAHPEAMRKGRELRTNINEKQREIRKTTRQIRKDRDDSVYGLEEYDQMLEKAESDLQAVRTEQQNALNRFDTETAKSIEADIRNKYREQLDADRAASEELAGKSRAMENALDQINREIASRYAPYIGEKYCTTESVEQMAEKIRTGKASDVSEALQQLQAEQN